MNPATGTISHNYPYVQFLMDINVANSKYTGKITGGKILLNHDSTNTIEDSTQIDIERIPSRIESIHPNPAIDQITVTYTLTEVENAYITVSNYYFTSVYDNYVLDINSNSKTVPVWNYATGFYIVTLVCDGQVADVKTFIKH